MIEAVREAIRAEMWEWGVQLGKDELTAVARVAIEAAVKGEGLVLKEDLLRQARRVRNFSNPEDVFRAVPVRFIESMDETAISAQHSGEPETSGALTAEAEGRSEVTQKDPNP